MTLKTKMLKNLISVLCATTIATSCVVTSVGAVPSVSNQQNNQNNEIKNVQRELQAKVKEYKKTFERFIEWKKGKISKEQDWTRNARSKVGKFCEANPDVLKPNYNNVEKMRELITMLDSTTDMLKNFMNNFKNNEIKNVQRELQAKVKEYKKTFERFIEWKKGKISKEQDWTRNARSKVDKFFEANPDVLKPNYNNVEKMRELITMLDSTTNMLKNFMNNFKNNEIKNVQRELQAKVKEYMKTFERFAEWKKGKISKEQDWTRNARSKVRKFFEANPDVLKPNYNNVKKMRELITMVDGTTNMLKNFMNNFKNNEINNVHIKVEERVKKYRKTTKKFSEWKKGKISEDQDLTHDYIRKVDEFFKANPTVLEPNYNNVEKMRELITILDSATKMMKNFMNNFKNDEMQSLKATVKNKCKEFNQQFTFFNQWRNLMQSMHVGSKGRIGISFEAPEELKFNQPEGVFFNKPATKNWIQVRIPKKDPTEMINAKAWQYYNKIENNLDSKNVEKFSKLVDTAVNKMNWFISNFNKPLQTIKEDSEELEESKFLNEDLDGETVKQLRKHFMFL